MTGITINQNPEMCRYLVDELKAFESDPIVIVDLGARWGFNAEWAVFGDQIRLFCFEPDKAEYEQLTKDAPDNVTYIPWAIGGVAGDATLYEAKLGASTSLYKTDMAYFGRLLNRDNAIVVAEHPIEVHTLDEAIEAYDIPSVDFIKLDTEGAEVDALSGSPKFLSSSSLLGMMSEIRFHHEINGCPTFSDLDALVTQFGFRLYDLQYNRQSRRGLPYPGLNDYRLPNGTRFFAYTTRGQVQDGDAIYFRDPLIAANHEWGTSLSPTCILKLCALFELYSLNDCAGELILHNRAILQQKVDVDLLLNFLVSGIHERPIVYEHYMAEYFCDSPKSPSNPSYSYSIFRSLKEILPTPAVRLLQLIIHAKIKTFLKKF